ncbi:myosin-2 heavy chain-like isoform X1 [Canna indica]|uniref:Myosin-2 heavy chain-like isoform X1 n=1 Tax=Canna indica TaxID=4628 RepID=A0AAQ3QES4_9LILI|nr:myosin-2 heavy chain-like isoform X1 [Canna indica]
MFKLHRHRSDKFGDKIEFKLSNLQAIKVPRGWDRLLLSIISVQSGKVIARTGKATVRSGNCQWTETESIWVSQDDATKELEECQFKIVVSLASSRSAILGEVILNLTDHLTNEDSGPLFLPLKKCDSGTTLQVKIQCSNPKSKFRVGISGKRTNSHLEENNNNEDLDSKSDGSDHRVNMSVRSSPSNRLSNTSHPDESGNRETYFSASGSHHSSDSGDSFGRAAFSPKNNLNGGRHVGRQDSSGSHISAAYSAGPADEPLRSNPSSFNSRASGSSAYNQWQDLTVQASDNGLKTPSLRPSDSSKDLAEAAEEIEELHDEVKMWERHSKQLKADLDVLKKEISEKSKHQANLDKQLSAVYNERDSLKLEVEQLKAALEESISKKSDSCSVNNEDMVHMQKELEDELKFQKESNANLTQQLRQTQESNIELVSILQELEEIIEKQKLEIANLSQENHAGGDGYRNNKSLDNAVEWERKLALKEEEITKLEEKLYNIVNNEQQNDSLSDVVHSDLINEIEVLRSKVNELERDCTELTDENLELIFKLKESEKGNHLHSSRSEMLCDRASSDNYEFEKVLENVLTGMDKQIRLALAQAKNLFSNDSSDADNAFGSMNDIEFPGTDLMVESIDKRLHELNDLLRESICSFSVLETEKAEKKTNDKESIEDEFQSTLFLKEQDVNRLQCSNKELEDLVCILQKEKCQLEQDLASVHREYTDTSKHLQDVEHNLLVLTGSVEFNASANKALERKSTELESCKNELELHVSELEQENVNLSERISGLEAQLRYLTNEQESNRLELEDYRSLATDLKHEVEDQKAEMEIQKTELKQKLQESQKRLSEVLEESDLSNRSNSKLQGTIENLIEECSSLQKLNEDLKRQKLELHQHITHLEVELDESKKKNIAFCTQVDLLEVKLSSMQKEIASKEKSLLSQLEKIFQDHKEHEERIGKAHILLNKMELEKAVEVENLEKEIANLSSQMSSNHDDQEKIASDAVCEASLLRSDKAKLECNLQEVNSKVKIFEADLENHRQESKIKIQGLVDLLNASKQSEEMLMADIEHMQRTIDSVKSSEENYRKMASDMELKLKGSEYEKQQVLEEISALKTQLQKMTHLQNSVLDLKSSLDEANFEKRKSEELLKSLSEEYEELKGEKESLMEKVSNMQMAISNGQDDRRSRIVLQGKLLRLESDLSVKEASYAQEAELKNELNRIKRTNSEYQRKVQSLEQENVELIEKVQNMEKELMLRKTSYSDKKVSSEGVDHDSKIVGTQLTEAVQANSMSEMQLKRVISEKQVDHPEEPKKTVNDNTDKISSLEAELKDMKERFLSMSLQYAEVEAQREELVMQLKSVKKEKRWFS